MLRFGGSLGVAARLFVKLDLEIDAAMLPRLDTGTNAEPAASAAASASAITGLMLARGVPARLFVKLDLGTDAAMLSRLDTGMNAAPAASATAAVTGLMLARGVSSNCCTTDPLVDSMPAGAAAISLHAPRHVMMQILV